MKTTLMKLAAVCVFMTSCTTVSENTEPNNGSITVSTEFTASETTTEDETTYISSETASETSVVVSDTVTDTELTETVTEQPPETEFDYTICFTGDNSAADGARTTNRWIDHGRDTSFCFDETMMKHMQEADICFATALAELHITGTRSDHSIELKYIPAMQAECTVSCITSPGEQEKYYRYLESISPNCVFDENGICSEKK